MTIVGVLPYDEVSPGEVGAVITVTAPDPGGRLWGGIMADAPVQITIELSARTGNYKAHVVGWGVRAGKYGSIWSRDLDMTAPPTASASEVMGALGQALVTALEAPQVRPSPS